MKKAASIVSWIEGIASIILIIIHFSTGRFTFESEPVYVSGEGYVEQMVVERVPYPRWVWALVIPFIIAVIVILAFRETVDANNKLILGVLTIIFVNLIGGILTLCIPDSELCQNNIITTQSSYGKPRYSSPDSRAAKVNALVKRMEKGEITMEEYRRELDLLNQESKKNLSQGSITPVGRASRIAELDKKLANGDISREEYDAEVAYINELSNK